MLIQDYTEKDVKFAGITSEVSHDFDPTSRSSVLSAIDRGKRTKNIANVLTRDHDAVFYLDAYNIKLSALDGSEEILLRLPIHQVAAISYLWADKHHVLVVKFGGAESFARSHTLNIQSCHLAVLYCDSRETAELLCTAVEQSFQSVYTAATMKYFDRTVGDGGAHASEAFYNTPEGLSPIYPEKLSIQDTSSLGFRAKSMLNLSNAGTMSSLVSRSVSRTTRQSSESELSATANDLIVEYMRKLKTKLNSAELVQFAQLMKSWQTNMSISTFCETVLELYGPERKYLLADMHPFIPAKDTAFFERFLKKNVMRNDSSDNEFEIIEVPDQRVPLGRPRLPWQTASVESNLNCFDYPLDCFDQQLDDITGGIESLGSRRSISNRSSPNEYLRN